MIYDNEDVIFAMTIGGMLLVALMIFMMVEGGCK